MRSEPITIRLEDLPELAAPVAMAGGIEEPGDGQPYANTSVLLALLIYSGSAA